MRKIKIAAVLAAALATFGAQAAVVTQSAALNLEVTEISQTFNFDAFDTALGTLNSVSVLLDGQAISSLSFNNSASGAQRFSFGSTLSLFLSGTGLSGNDELALNLFTYSASTPVGTTTLPSVDVKDTLTASADVAAFTSGPVSFTCESLVNNSQGGGGGNILVDQKTQAGCGVTLQYDYTATVTPPAVVPEPASLALVGLALAGVAASRRRKA